MEEKLNCPYCDGKVMKDNKKFFSGIELTIFSYITMLALGFSIGPYFTELINDHMGYVVAGCLGLGAGHLFASFFPIYKCEKCSKYCSRIRISLE